MLDDAIFDIDPKESFRRAKVEHFLERAEEFYQMARFGEARRAVERVSGLDPENETLRNFRRTMEERWKAIAERTNGNGHKRRRGEIVMVVDQDERVLTSLADTLTRNGFEVVGAATYDEAVETLGMVEPDLIISEVNFESGPRGFDLYLWLRTNERFVHVPFMFYANRIDRETLIAGKRFGVDDFILKPADSEVVTASVVNCLSRRKLQPQNGGTSHP
jgi:PleD family two-component response regulator